MRSLYAAIAAGLGLILLLGAGCSKKGYDISDTRLATAGAGTAQPPVITPRERPTPPLTGILRTDSMEGPGEQKISDQPVTTSAHHVAVDPTEGLQDVYFTYDSWRLNEDGRQALAGDLDQLKAALPKRKLLIEGHCDERGTESYNLVLGERRAKAVEQYLLNLGVPADRVGVVSYGEKRPFCTGHGEPCWKQNRRAHLAVRAS